jgi:O-antigen biosynthesis protein
LLSATTPAPTSELLALYRAHDGKVSDKWLSYLIFYEELFRSYRDFPVRILEIGVQNGGSLEVWSRFFPKAEKIVGCDINPNCEKLTYDDPRISVVVGDANSPDYFARVMALSESYDIIIDDGSHLSSDIVRSFALYFPRVAEGGLFVAEDLHCSYWNGYEGGIEAPYSSISFFKRIADYVNREHWGASVQSETMLSFFADHWNIGFESSSLDLIDEVRFRNSVCAITKGKAGANLLGTRVVAGSLALVSPDINKGIDETANNCPDESTNPFGPMSPRLELAVSARDSAQLAQQEVTSLRHKVATLGQELATLGQELANLGQEQATLRQERATLTQENAALRQEEVTLRRELLSIKDELDVVNILAESIGSDLVAARRRPHKLIMDLLIYRLLRVLARATPPLPTRVTARFARSAAKRDPRRIIPPAAESGVGAMSGEGAKDS